MDKMKIKELLGSANGDGPEVKQVIKNELLKRLQGKVVKVLQIDKSLSNSMVELKNAIGNKTAIVFVIG